MHEPCVCYLVGTYPSVTTTFIDREIRMLRHWGLQIRLLAMRMPRLQNALSEEQRWLQKEVIYLIPVKWPAFVVGNLRFLAMHPGTYLGTLLYLVTRRHPTLKHRMMTVLHFAEGVYAAHLLRGEQAGHLHAHFMDRAATVALVAGRLLGVPYSLTAHARDIYVDPVLLPEKLLEAQFVATCTAYNKAHLVQFLEGAQVGDKLHVVYHGLDVASYVPPARRREGPRLVFSVGRLTEKKGFLHLAVACRRLKDRGYAFTCEIVGEGPQRPELEALVAQLGMEDVITLCGAIPHEQVIEKYRQATLFALPCVEAQDGDRDGIPNVLMEAMAMELPVVSTSLSGIPELVRDGIDGLLVRPGDAEALADALADLFDDPALRTRLGCCGRERVIAGFDAEDTTRSLFHLYAANRT